MSHEYSRSRSSVSSIPWIWIGILGGIVLLIIIARVWSGSSSVDTTRSSLLVTPDSSASTVFIAMSESSKNRISGTGSQPLYVGDYALSVESGGARLVGSNTIIDIAERSEFAYLSQSSTGSTYQMTRWHIWIDQLTDTTTTEMKNISITTDPGDIALLEQSNQIYSTVYAIRWDITIRSTHSEYILKAGNRIMVSASDLSNPGLQMGTLAGGIDESITQNPLFIKNNGKNLLTSTSMTGSVSSTTSGSITPTAGSGISIIEPTPGSIVTTPTMTIRGTITSDIKRITVDNIDAVISPVNGTFAYTGFPITSETNDIVYKGYDERGQQVQVGVLTVFGSKQALQSIQKLLPNASPLSSSEYRITSPTNNPYVMTDRATKVQWTVPKDTVGSIIVNDYKLQKFIPGSTTWYYFANMESGTMKDGINLYTIKFMWNKGELLYTQLFTIIKESKNVTISGETSR